MSNVTSLELSKELYTISGWRDTSYLWHLINGKAAYAVFAGANGYNGGNKLEDYEMHAYELGYLLDKLDCEILGQLSLSKYRGDIWSASFLVDPSEIIIFAKGDTHVNAIAKLCIELFKNGILTREKE